MNEIQNNMQYNAQTDPVNDFQKMVPPQSAARVNQSDATPLIMPGHNFAKMSNAGAQPDFTPTDRADQRSQHSQFQQYAQD